MSVKRLAVIAAVGSHNAYNQQQNNTNFNTEKSVNHQGLQTMRSSGGSNSGNTTSLHGNVNIMLGGSMLSVVITVVCFVCYCCHRNIKKRTASAYRQQRWLENDPNMEIYSVEQCYDTSGLFVEQHHHHHHQSDQISIQPTTNLHGPPPSYEAVVALDEIIGRNLNLNLNNKENHQTNNNINLDNNNLTLEKLEQTTNNNINASDTNIDIVIDENIFTQLYNENIINNQLNNNVENIYNKRNNDNDDEYTNQILTNAAIAAIANRKRNNKRIQYCNCNENELINNNNNEKCNKCNQIIIKNKNKNLNELNLNNNNNDDDGACSSSLDYVKTMNSPIKLTPAPTPTLEINDIFNNNNNNNNNNDNNNNELILENNVINNDNNNNLTSIIHHNDINDNLNNNNIIADNFNNNNNNNLEIFATTSVELINNNNNNIENLLNNNNNNNINPIDFTSLNENGLIRMDMSKIIDKTGLPTYEAALKLKSSGYV